LKSAQFFDAANHPKIIFTATGFEKSGKDTYDVKGKLTLRGVTKDLSTSVKYTGEGKDPWGGYRIGFITTFKIKRSEFGINFPVAMLGDEVTLTVSLEGMRKLGKDEK
jgi:polyisoprenoid-binding protein YceI